MKSAFLLVAMCAAFLLVGCSDPSLITDEEYYKYKQPAAFSPDYSGVLPENQVQRR